MSPMFSTRNRIELRPNVNISNFISDVKPFAISSSLRLSEATSPANPFEAKLKAKNCCKGESSFFWTTR